MKKIGTVEGWDVYRNGEELELRNADGVKMFGGFMGEDEDPLTIVRETLPALLNRYGKREIYEDPNMPGTYRRDPIAPVKAEELWSFVPDSIDVDHFAIHRQDGVLYLGLCGREAGKDAWFSVKVTPLQATEIMKGEITPLQCCELIHAGTIN